MFFFGVDRRTLIVGTGRFDFVASTFGGLLLESNIFGDSFSFFGCLTSSLVSTKNVLSKLDVETSNVFAIFSMICLK